MSTPHVVVVMGVAGTGRPRSVPCSRPRSAFPYAEGDDFHPPANIAKMSAGTPLDDADRWPWLDAIGAWAARPGRARRGGQLLRAQARVPRPAAAGRARTSSSCTSPATARSSRTGCPHRKGHFMPTALLDSQFATLQPLEADEAGVVVDVSGAPEEITERAVAALRDSTRRRRSPALRLVRHVSLTPPPLPHSRNHRDQTQRRDAGSGRRRADHLGGHTRSWASPFSRASPSSSCSSPSSSCTPSWR